MGTSNFARGNTSRVFAVLMDEQDDVEDFVDFVREVAKESAPKDIQYSKEDGSAHQKIFSTVKRTVAIEIGITMHPIYSATK
jgi:hypothetical protein